MINIAKLEKFLSEQDKKLTAAKRSYRSIMEDVPNKNIGNFIQFPIFPKIYSKDPIFRGQKWLYSGFVISLGDIQILVDPGIEMLSRLRISGINPVKTTHLVITHNHIDHVNDIDVIIENMSYKRGDFKGTVIAPSDIIDRLKQGNFRGCRGISNPFILTEFVDKKQIHLSDTVHLEAHRMNHPDTFGFKIIADKNVVGYTSDTGYSHSFETTDGLFKTGDAYTGEILQVLDADPSIPEFFIDCDILIANLNDHFFRKHSTTHLTTFDLIHLLGFIQVKQCILTHHSPYQTLGKYDTDLLAKYIEVKTKKKTMIQGVKGLLIKLN